MEQAILILTGFNVTNGAIRLIAGYLSGIMERRLTMGLTFWAGGLGYLLLPRVNGFGAWMVAAVVVGFAFGQVFAAYAFVVGPLEPWLSGHILDQTGGNFTLVFTYLGSLCLVSAVLIRCVRPPKP